MALGGECAPIPADVALLKILSGEPLTDVCVLCACTSSLIKMDDTNYVHLNDEYNDRRLTILQLVKESQLGQLIGAASSHVICENCVYNLCTFQLFKNKCHKVNRGLSALTKLVKGDLLEKVVNISTGLPATVLPYKHLHQYYDSDGEKATDMPDIIGIESNIETESTSDDEDRMNIIKRAAKSEYKCALCPERLKKRELAQHVLSHYYKNVTRNVILKRSFCVCCLREEELATRAVSVAEESGDMSLNDILCEVFGYLEAMDLGSVEVCGSCLGKLVSLYNFKKMFHASSTIIRDCVLALQVCLEEPRSATTTTEDSDNHNICLLELYNLFIQVSDDRTQTIAPFLKVIKLPGDAKTLREIKPKPFQRYRRLSLNKPLTKKMGRSKYMCTLCGITSATLNEAKDHRLSHCVPRKTEQPERTTEVSVACHICAEEFVDASELNSHVTNKHSDISFCPFCDKFYKDSTKLLLNPHMEACKSIPKPFKCDICSASFTSKGKLVAHRVRHFPQSVQCDFCKKKFWTVRELRTHQTKHHREVLGIKFECSMCPLDFRTKTDRVQHALTHGPDTRHVCRFCPTTFRLKTNYIAHKCLGKMAHLRKNDRRVNRLKMAAEIDATVTEAESESDSEREDGAMSCICDLCGKLFKTERYLKAHQRTHHDSSDEATAEVGRANRERPVKQLSCTSCDYTTVYKNCLEAHVNRQHKNVKPYACLSCERRFYSRVNQVQHMKTHVVDNTLDCEFCAKQFSSKKALVLHTRLHTGEKPYGCDMCEEKFVSSSRRQDHRLRKHFEPSVQCELCSRYFYTQREYRTHVRDSHEEKTRRQPLVRQGQILNEQ